MLQAIADTDDHNFLRSQQNFVDALVAARNDGKKHLLLAASGSVATIKSQPRPLFSPFSLATNTSAVPNIINALESVPNLSIRLILTQPAQHFLAGQSSEQPSLSVLQHLPHVDAIYDDAAEWGPEPWRRGASILHIELRRWADVLVVAPLSANTLAKIVNGMSDNLLLSAIRAWDTDGSIDGKKKRIVVCPAMNTAMWRHPITDKQLRVLREDWGVKDPSVEGGPEQSGWFEVIQPISKTLACGDSGDGAMASVDEIVQVIKERLDL